MVSKNDIVEIKIDSLAYGGEGVGRFERFPIFVDDCAPGDVLKAQIITKQNSYARARIVEIVEPSPLRVEPECAMAKICGGCNWQHIEYSAQLAAKKQIVEDNMRKFANVEIQVKEVLASDHIFNYRCKIQNPVQQTKVSKRFLLGYYKKGSHELINIKHCPIQPEPIEKVAEFIRTKAQALEITAYNEKRHKGLLRHVVFRYSQSDNNMLVIFIINSGNIPDEIVELAKAVKAEFNYIVGTLVNFNTKNNNVIFGGQTVLIEGQDYIEERLGDRVYKITAGSFFQVNPSSAVKMFDTVKDMISERLRNPSILDVYAGVGSFAIWLKDIASSMTSIEEYPQAVDDARANIELNRHIKGTEINILEGNADTVLQNLAKDSAQYDVLILDPPRKGCSAEAIEAASLLAQKYIIYVSCNPSTLARDLKLLHERGFATEYIQPVDMFCHTYHVESIALLKKKAV